MLRIDRAVRCALVALLVLAMLPGAAAGRSVEVAPITTLTTEPAIPDGENGWFAGPAGVYATSNQNGTVYYTWDGGPQASKPITAGTPVNVGVAGDGEHMVVAYTVNAAEETETPGSVITLKVDTGVPTQPQSLSAVTQAGPSVSLQWNDSNDAVSGIDGYVVYRNLTGGPFVPSDEIARVDSSEYVDSNLPAEPGAYYAVSALDVAGNESTLSETVYAVYDSEPPSEPTALEAWLNAADTARVVWSASVDEGFGVASYEVSRSVDGADPVFAGSVGGSQVFFDDTDPVVTGPDPVDYFVTAVDGVGLRSTPAGPARMQVDVTLPTTPTSLTANVVAGPDVELDWNDSSDTGSGLAGYVVYRNLTGEPFTAADEIARTTTSDYTDFEPPVATGAYYAVSALDVAGNESARSAAVLATLDATPPTRPGNLEAWRNATDVALVRWTPSVDVGFGVAEYRIARRVGSGLFEVIGIVPADTTSFTDDDPEVIGPGPVAYTVTAVDMIGLESVPGGPVNLIADLEAPRLPVGYPAVTPAFEPGIGTRFDVAWGQVSDAISGIYSAKLEYGFSPGATEAVLDATAPGGTTLTSGQPAQMVYCRLVAEDRAGNVARSEDAQARYISVDRVAGIERVATSLAVSRTAFEKADVVLFASALQYPDALCASALAGVVRGPVILVRPGALPEETKAELKRLGALGAYVIGGTAAVSPETFASIEAELAGSVVRLAGPTRYETAAAVARRVSELAQTDGGSRVYVVSGENFADALSVGGAAYAGKDPILYARPDSVPAVTRTVIAEIGPASCIVVGGSAAVTPDAESLLPKVTRVAGTDRYLTATAFAAWTAKDGVIDMSNAVLATGADFPDGLAAGPMAGELTCPVVLTNESRALWTAEWLAGHRSALESVFLSGGTAVVSDSQRDLIWVTISQP